MKKYVCVANDIDNKTIWYVRLTFGRHVLLVQSNRLFSIYYLKDCVGKFKTILIVMSAQGNQQFKVSRKLGFHWRV